MKLQRWRLKKNLANEIAANPEAELFFFDESRFGTHSKLGHAWFITGERSRIDVKLGFQNFYLYGAVNHNSGDSFNLLMPSVDTNSMNLFLEEFAKEIGNKKVIMVMDGAGWHKSKDLKTPNNIKLIFLPPYSPELNPIERLWLYIKQNVIKNKFYESIDLLEDALCKFICAMTNEVIKKVCAVNYLGN